MRPRRLLLSLSSGWLVVAGLAWPSSGAGQLISPGKLSAAHADLVGIRNCTQCHELRKAGISEALCLECHEPLAERIEAGRGFHASISESERACATCHKEHFGEDFDLVRLDTLTFDHTRTGYALDGRHEEVGCRSCHELERIADPAVWAAKGKHQALGRTFLGLPTRCASCHEHDSPHGSQFHGKACTDCHDTGGWKGAGEFDHDHTTFRLTGRHRRLSCDECHETTEGGDGLPPTVRYIGVEGRRCTDCHEDEHHGAMPGQCERCHSTAGWRSVDRGRVERTFDHRGTGFLLEGSHASAPCAACHQASGRRSDDGGVRIRFVAGTRGRTFPRPVVRSGRCLSCHEDPHDGTFAEREDEGDCRACHAQDSWLPALFDAVRHNRETPFRLEGAHLAVACESCHEEGKEDGKRAPSFELKASTCIDCHTGSNPHGVQFAGRACDACHGLDSFRIDAFDHDETHFPLDGAHREAECAACHRTGTDAEDASVVVYRPLGTECRDCHGGAA